MAIDGLHRLAGDDDLPDHDDASRIRNADGARGQRAESSAPDRPREESRDRDQYYTDLRREADAQRIADDEPRAANDGGWAWKGLELSPEENRIADKAISERREAEGRDVNGHYGDLGITPAMRRIEAQLEHGRLVPNTEKFALKSPDRFKEKLAKVIALEPDRSPSELAAEIHDGIRYTFLFETDKYTDGVKRTCEKLENDNYKLIGLKPVWKGEEYKGINSKWEDSHSNQLLEVQFHTPESWEAKQQTHDSYEKIESPLTPAEERVRLRAYQREVSASVPVPPGALEFRPYEYDGR